MPSSNQHKWDAAGDHLIWQVVAGMLVPFVFAVLIGVLRASEGGVRGLVDNGEIHFATGAMLLSSIPAISKGMNAPSSARMVWQFVGVLSITLMVSSILTWADLSGRRQVDGMHFRIALEGGILAAMLAALLTYTMVWRAT